jgi:hypothetical protein
MAIGSVLSRVVVGACVVALAGCGAEPKPAEATRSTKARQFFENAERRDATAAEGSRVAQLTTSKCASFFLENTANTVYVATARHCVDFAITTWCTNDGALADNSGSQGKCARLVAADKTHDIAVFEASIAHAAAGDTTLRLASYVPPVNTKLVMTGYPGDEDPQTARRGKLTTTRSCWVLGGEIDSPYATQDTKTLDKAVQHNCSTYGGNSGGPMYVEGTRDAIGLPFTYVPDDYTRNSATDLATAAHLALMADFVRVHRTELTAAGIVISDTASTDPETTPPEDAPGTESESTDTLETGPTSDLEDEEDTAPKKNKKLPAPIATQPGCAMAPGGPTDRAVALVLVALGLLRVRSRERRCPSRSPSSPGDRASGC